MYANRDIRLALFAAARAEPGIAWHTGVEVVKRERGPHGVAATLSDGRVLEGSLLVGAEGRRSPTREEEGIGLVAWDYHHHAIVAALAHEKPHDNVAWEIFYSAGPFALLPLNDLPDATASGLRHRSALVWTVPAKDAPGVMAMSEPTFLAEMQRAMGGMFGRVELIARARPGRSATRTPRASWATGWRWWAMRRTGCTRSPGRAEPGPARCGRAGGSAG
jgi:2-octaprenyl-6-methoxyphenol hydroxylase